MSGRLPKTKLLKLSDFRHSSVEDSPANLIAVQDSVKALVTAVTSGQRFGESLVKLNQDGSWEKMCQDSDQARKGSSSDVSSGTWSRWGIASDGVVGRLPMLEPPTIGRGSSLRRTPNTLDSLAPKSQQALNHEAIDARPGRKEPNNLRDQVAVREGIRMWPTPTTQEVEHPGLVLTATGRRMTKDGKDSHSVGLADAVKLWPTPSSRDHKGQNSIEHIERELLKKKHAHLGQLPNEVLYRTGERGGLNPEWVEWLMGFPIGWTDLNASEMQ